MRQKTKIATASNLHSQTVQSWYFWVKKSFPMRKLHALSCDINIVMVTFANSFDRYQMPNFRFKTSPSRLKRGYNDLYLELCESLLANFFSSKHLHILNRLVFGYIVGHVIIFAKKKRCHQISPSLGVLGSPKKFGPLQVCIRSVNTHSFQITLKIFSFSQTTPRNSTTKFGSR